MLLKSHKLLQLWLTQQANMTIDWTDSELLFFTLSHLRICYVRPERIERKEREENI